MIKASFDQIGWATGSLIRCSNNQLFTWHNERMRAISQALLIFERHSESWIGIPIFSQPLKE